MKTQTAALRLVLITVVMLVILASPCLSAPTVTWDISVADGIKTYTYTLTNDEPWGDIHEFAIYMPEAGARSVIDVDPGGNSWSIEYGFFGDYSYWGWIAGLIDYGGSSVFWLRTPADMPTIYDYTYGNRSSNWIYGLPRTLGQGDTSLPVPSGVVPEPSGLLALLCGMGGLAGAALKRRR